MNRKQVGVKNFKKLNQFGGYKIKIIMAIDYLEYC